MCAYIYTERKVGKKEGGGKNYSVQCGIILNISIFNLNIHLVSRYSS